jgi:hypothetical protein
VRTVALQFTNAEFSQDPFSVVKYFVPASQRYFARAIGEAERSGSITRGSARHVVVATVVVHGQKAIVTLTGTFCLPTPGRSSSSRQHCQTNANPHSTNPAYLLFLDKVGSRWYIGGNPAAANNQGQRSAVFATTSPSPYH